MRLETKWYILMQFVGEAMQRKLSIALIALLLLSAIPFTASADETKDIPSNAADSENHNSLVAALDHAGLVETLSGDGPFTVFAPTDQAFADAGIDLNSFDTESENQTLVDILTYHVVSGAVMSSDLTDAGTTDAYNGDKLSFSVSDTEIKVNDAVVTTANLESSNGVIHVIDKILMPPVDVYVGDGSMSEPYFEFFTDAEGTNALTEIDISKSYKFQRLNNPSTHPFYVSDVGYNTDSSESLIIAGDGTSTTGISDDESFTIFFRDAFVVQDALGYFCTVHEDMEGMFTLTEPLADIPSVAASTNIHTSLVAAFAHVDLVTTLQGDGPFTVFAPTDQAFIDAGINLSTYDTAEENDTLADILLYHVVEGSVMSSDLTDGMTATTANTDSLTFSVSADGVMVNDANVTQADFTASNGVIHVIDKILMPPTDEATEPVEPIVPEVVCAATIGITSDGLGFSPAYVEINVGDTVCWKWNNESMDHNVKQVTGKKSTNYVENGVYSGSPAATVDFSHTFTENTTFWYACVPHIYSDMYGKIVVGDGGVETTVMDEEKNKKKGNNTPGFLGFSAIIATLGAVLFASKRHYSEL